MREGASMQSSTVLIGAEVARQEACLEELISRQAPGYCLERAFYVDDWIFELDLQRVFRRHWFLAGFVAQIPNPGDYLLARVGVESIVVLRDHDGAIRASLNVCSHRGSRLLREPSGHLSKRIVCPYHAWAFDLDGGLRTALDTPPGFDPACFHLQTVHVSVVSGLVFVSLAEEPPPFDRGAAQIAPFLDAYQFERVDVAAVKNYHVNANWKLVVENFLECYHCGPAHSEYCSVHESAIPYSVGGPKALARYEQRIEDWSKKVSKLGHPVGATADGAHFVGANPAADSDIRDIEQFTSESFSAWRIPLREGYVTQSQDGRPVAPLMGSFVDYDGGETGAIVGPCSAVLGAADYAVLMRFVPVTAMETDVEATWVVRKGAKAGRDYDPDEVIWLWDVTTAQDRDLVGNNQAGILSRSFAPGPYAQCESDVRRFVAGYLTDLRRSQPAADDVDDLHILTP
jgi:phenylpropionate dioxygenase-like ring-hydroxylating dioxygenase large terminal subunit